MKNTLAIPVSRISLSLANRLQRLLPLSQETEVTLITGTFVQLASCNRAQVPMYISKVGKLFRSSTCMWSTSWIEKKNKQKKTVMYYCINLLLIVINFALC